MSIPVIFTMDNLGDAADLQRRLITAPRPAGSNPALERGFPALLDLFGKYAIPLTCFVEGWSATHYPQQIRQLCELGHALGMHGWQHEVWSELEDAEVVDLATRATQAITAAAGKPPLAFRAPGGFSTPLTWTVLQDLGYTIDASFTASNNRVVLTQDLLSIPYQWSGVDATHWLWNRRSPAEAENLWRTALDDAAAHEEHFVFIWHPHVMGLNADWLATGERIIRFVLEDPRFHVSTLQELRVQITLPRTQGS